MAGKRSLTPKQQRFVEEYLINAERFWGYVDKSDSTQCWNWQGAKDKLGYGRFHIGLSRHSTMLSHRVAFGLCSGETPEAVCHKCDNPSCCNPSHLFGGTRDDNNKDMAKKGRNRVPKMKLRGEKHHQAKITNIGAQEIARQYAKGGVTQYQLAEEHGVCQRTINKIVNGISFNV